MQIILKLKTIYKNPPPTPPPPKKTHTCTHTQKTSFQTKPVCQSLSVKNCCLTLHSVSEKLFSVCNQEIPIRYVRWWEPEGHASFLCVKNWIHTWFSAWHTSRTCHSYQTEFNTDLNTRDRQTSSNVCLLKLKEKQQHIKNAIRSQSMASLSQIPVLNFSVCKKNWKMLHVLWTVTILKCPYIPKVFIYTRAVKMFIIKL